MKKGIALLMIIFVLFGNLSCGASRSLPEDQVSAFFDALKARDEAVLAEYINNDRINVLLHSKGDKAQLEQMYSYLFEHFSYKILSVDTDGESPTVTVEVANADFSKVMKNYKKKAYDYTIRNLYSDKVNKKKLNRTCLKLFVAEVKKASEKKDLRTETVTVALEPNDFATWSLILDDALMDAVMGGMVIPFVEKKE